MIKGLSHLVTASLISDIETSVNRGFANSFANHEGRDGVGVILMKETKQPGLPFWIFEGLLWLTTEHSVCFLAK